MNLKTLDQTQNEATHLVALLSALHTELPDNLAENEVNTCCAAGWAGRIVTDLANDINLYDTHQQEAAKANGGKK